jgi:AAA15 family ATPase/GTPase
LYFCSNRKVCANKPATFHIPTVSSNIDEENTIMNNLIKKIEIHSFRSIEKLSLTTKELNIFSGTNDVGKSNILKALNLFFNTQTDFVKPLKFEDDYNKVSRAKMLRSSKMKQLIKIRLYLNPPSSYKTLSNEKHIFLERQFDRYGERYEKYSTSDNKKKASIKRIINKVKYIYIPALKGEEVLQYLLSLIGEQQLISETDIINLNTSITTKTKDLKEILESSEIPIGTTFGLPTFLSDFWQKLSVNTEYEQFEKLDNEISGSNSSRPLNVSQFTISLLFRGEGIKSKYIPPLLKWLDKNDNSKEFIWGIDEPENSLEFGLADKLARLYFNDYAQSNQIFLTSHSLAFINPPKEIKIIPKRFKVFKDDFGRTQWKDIDDLFEKQNRIDLYDELGILIAQREFIEEYRNVVAEKEQLDSKISDYSKPIIIVEGKTDKWIIEIAWSKLNPNSELPFEIFPSGRYIDEDESSGSAEQVQNTIEFVSPMIDRNKIIIGLFDNDKEGNNRFKGLNKILFKTYQITNIVREHKTKKIYGLLIPTPTHRADFVSNKIEHRFLEIEHYFSDQVLQTYNMKGDKVAPDSQIFTIKSKHKTKFAEEKICDLNEDEFDNFNLLFDKIQEIVN